MTGAPASATIYISPGSEIVEWDSKLLRKQTARNDKLRVALDARLAQDHCQSHDRPCLGTGMEFLRGGYIGVFPVGRSG